MSEPRDIPEAVRDLAVSLGFHIVPGNPPFIYGPLDSLAIVLDLLMEEYQECSEDLKLSIMAKSIAETPFCDESTKQLDRPQQL